MSRTDASIAMSVQDNLSAAIVGMRSSVTNFRSDITALQGELTRLNATRVQMRMDLTNARREAQQAQRAFESLGESATEAERQAAEADWRQAEENLENIRQQYDLVGRQVRQTTRDMENATGAISRMENRAGGAAGRTGILSALGKAGLGQMAGDAILEIGNTMIGSALGSGGGSLISSALSSAVSGAAMGSLAGPVGTAIGTAVGGVLGLATGGAQIFASQDEAFKAYYGDLYQAGQDRASESLTSGSATASQRELDAIAFNRLLGSGVGDKYLSDLRVLAAETPMEYSDLTAMSRALATGFGDNPERMLELMTAIGDAGSAVGVTASDMTAMAQAMSRMNSSGKATLEYLNIFQDRGVDVIGMLSEAMGKTQGEIYDMISKGEINGQDAANIIQQGMETAYGGAMELMAETFSGLTSTLEDTIAELDNARGEGYNQERASGLQAEIDAYGGALGDAVQNLNRISGENEAYMENLSGQYTREALSALLLGEDTTLFTEDQQAELRQMREAFLAASSAYEDGNEEAGLKMESLRQQAEALATIAYESSDQYELLYDSELDLIDAIRDNTAAHKGWMNEYGLNQELSKGRGDVALENAMLGDPDDPTDGFVGKGRGLEERLTAQLGGGYAYGLDRVPRNGLYYLHQDERVLTAREAGEQSRKSGATIQVTIKDNHFGADLSVEAVAQTLADLLERKLAAGVIG